MASLDITLMLLDTLSCATLQELHEVWEQTCSGPNPFTEELCQRNPEVCPCTTCTWTNPHHNFQPTV